MMRGRSLFASLALWIGVGFLALQISSFIFWGHERMLARAQTFAETAADRTLALVDITAGDIATLNRIIGSEFHIAWADAPVAIPTEPWGHNSEVHALVVERLRAQGFERADEVQVAFTAERRSRDATFHIQLPVGERWLHTSARTDVTRFGQDLASGVFMLLTLIIVVLAVLIATRRVTRYFATLADAADRLGAGEPYDALPEHRGPSEVRRASAAFNAMQRRVTDLLTERTQMLGAVSHDLRTIATRLRLRAEHIADTTQQQRAEQDIEDMTAILDETLTYARDESSDEAAVPIDLAALLHTLSDDYADLGHDVTFESSARPVLRGQPVALKRALGNLIDNAVRYGGSAHITCTADGTVRITDSGPGMSPEEAQRALEPFVRIDASRNRQSGGTGLGLTIASNVIRRHKGTLTFERVRDAFSAVVGLPVEPLADLR